MSNKQKRYTVQHVTCNLLFAMQNVPYFHTYQKIAPKLHCHIDLSLVKIALYGSSCIPLNLIPCLSESSMLYCLLSVGTIRCVCVAICQLTATTCELWLQSTKYSTQHNKINTDCVLVVYMQVTMINNSHVSCMLTLVSSVCAIYKLRISNLSH